jgi:hypothetical protein
MATARWAPAQNILAVTRQCPWLWRDGLPHRIFWLSRGSACGSGAMGSRAEYFGCLEAVPVATARWAPARNIVVLNDHNATTAQPYNQTTTQPHKHTPTQPHNHTTTQPRDQQTTQSHNRATHIHNHTQHTTTQPHDHTTTPPHDHTPIFPIHTHPHVTHIHNHTQPHAPPYTHPHNHIFPDS